MLIRHNKTHFDMTHLITNESSKKGSEPLKDRNSSTAFTLEIANKKNDSSFFFFAFAFNAKRLRLHQGASS